MNIKTTTAFLTKGKPLLILVLLTILVSCSRFKDLPPGSRIDIPSGHRVTQQDQPLAKPHTDLRQKGDPILESETVIIQAAEDQPPPTMDYVIGPHDLLSINVSGDPLLSSSPSLGSLDVKFGIREGTTIATTGCKVDGNGYIQLPYLGSVHVWGLTVSELQERLRTLYTKFIRNPWVVVQVKEYKSQPLYLLGQFRNAGTHYMDRPLRLMEAIALGNGYLESADITEARVIRGKKILPVDVYSLLTKGDQSQNIWVKPGDTVYIPDNKDRQVFVFGAVKKAGPVPIPPSGLSLAQAVAAAELRDTGYDITHVRIIRSHSPTRGELMVVDLESVMKGESLPLMLKKGDIIYVPKSRVGTWNDFLQEILPTLQTFSAVLSPFVQIKYLSD